jgi:hypothetical protein
MDECQQVFNFDKSPLNVVDTTEKAKEPEIVVDLSEEKLTVVPDEKKPKKAKDTEIIDF